MKFRAIFVSVISLFVVIVSCNNNQAPQKKNTEAREDSSKMALAVQLQSKISKKVKAITETEAVKTPAGEDAADDPAIWINKFDPERSIILGTDKKAGLYAYNLNGDVLQFIDAGLLNNIDLREGFYFNNTSQVLIAASNRSNNSISLFLLNPNTLQISDTIMNIKSNVDGVYGLCMHTDANENFYVFVNGNNGLIEQYKITSNNQRIFYKYCRSLKVNSQAEGMVVNDFSGKLYVAVEEEGIYKASAAPNGSSKLSLIKESTKANNEFISYDIEGLAIYHSAHKEYLIASIQGNFSYAVFDLKNNDKYIGSFIIENGHIDGVEETDGIEVSSFPVNSKYPKGILVVQDGFNYDRDSIASQNFKYISWKDIADLL